MPSSVPNLDQLLQQAGLSTEVPPSLGEWQNLLWRVRAALDRGRDAAQATGWAQHLLDKLSLPVLVLDRQGTVIHASEACGALGWSHDLRGRPLAELLSSPLEDLRLSNLLKRVWQGERLHQVPLSLRHTEGRLQLAEASLLPLHAASGESTAAYVAMSITTTELHGQSDDNARTDRQYFYESLLAALPASLAVLGPDQRYRFCNPAAIGNPQIREWIMGHTDAEYVAERGFPRSWPRSAGATWTRRRASAKPCSSRNGCCARTVSRSTSCATTLRCSTRTVSCCSTWGTAST